MACILSVGNAFLANAAPVAQGPGAQNAGLAGIPGRSPFSLNQSGTVAIQGVTGQGVAQRLNIQDLQNNHPEQFSLYILALQSMMNVSQGERQSWYGIAGIHGQRNPMGPWDGQKSPAGDNGYGYGYCTHSSNIFLTWHRPYVALFEQTLFAHALYIANSFPADRVQR